MDAIERLGHHVSFKSLSITVMLHYSNHSLKVDTMEIIEQRSLANWAGIYRLNDEVSGTVSNH